MIGETWRQRRAWSAEDDEVLYALLDDPAVELVRERLLAERRESARKAAKARWGAKP